MRASLHFCHAILVVGALSMLFAIWKGNYFHGEQSYLAFSPDEQAIQALIRQTNGVIQILNFIAVIFVIVKSSTNWKRFAILEGGFVLLFYAYMLLHNIALAVAVASWTP